MRTWAYCLRSRKNSKLNNTRVWMHCVHFTLHYSFSCVWCQLPWLPSISYNRSLHLHPGFSFFLSLQLSLLKQAEGVSSKDFTSSFLLTGTRDLRVLFLCSKLTVTVLSLSCDTKILLIFIPYVPSQCCEDGKSRSATWPTGKILDVGKTQFPKAFEPYYFLFHVSLPNAVRMGRVAPQLDQLKKF